MVLFKKEKEKTIIEKLCSSYSSRMAHWMAFVVLFLFLYISLGFNLFNNKYWGREKLARFHMLPIR